MVTVSVGLDVGLEKCLSLALRKVLALALKNFHVLGLGFEKKIIGLGLGLLN